ncbi:DUF1538 domain-containing protein [Rossellomorea vietnamensis]|uniref:DUF1538 domain-containing protein n=1 Tax=Rossellomorea vietnamensis TaxID=218284 RepID=A0A5D4K8I8_9BACI|nr:DUF1538 domain-containing protein [Rossellomorea vietnamensis]TYR73552.1 DUF1538 domain-containing protein [Rossellomorea vietnamensis]
MKDIKKSISDVLLSILPVGVVVTLLQIFVIKLEAEMFVQFLIGLVMVILGFIFFLVGVNKGLLSIGEKIGEILPKSKNTWIIIGVAFLLGFSVTVAEPDVRVLSSQVEQVSGGAVTSSMLILTVAIGVGVFIAIAMFQTLYKLPIHYFLIGGYSIVFLLAAFSGSGFRSVSFDAGGVTTGPITVPFILALGIGVASAVNKEKNSTEGFGLVALASIGPIIAVLLLGVFI